MRASTKTYFELAEKEKVVVKRGNKYVTLVVTNNPDTNFVSEDWIKEFMSIPMEYRCNPFEVSPSGDLFFADKRNVEKLNNAIGQSEVEKSVKATSVDELNSLLESL